MTSRAALVIIDVLNEFDLEHPDPLIAAAQTAVPPIAHLRAAARVENIPVIYVNDNYGRWRDERNDLIAHLTDDACRGAQIARALRPTDEDYFVVKPEASGFYATTLPALLPRLGVSRLVLTGIAADICVLFTAADAHMREYDLWIPANAVAAQSPDRVRWALELMADGMDAEVRSTDDLCLVEWLADQQHQ
jgi:nicotinamidase-related amidase